MKTRFPDYGFLRNSILNAVPTFGPDEVNKLISTALDGPKIRLREHIRGSKKSEKISSLIKIYDDEPNGLYELIELIRKYYPNIFNEISKQYDASEDASQDTPVNLKDVLYEELTGGDPLDDFPCKVENFDWGKSLSVPISISKDELTKIQDEIDILLVTAVETERDSILRLLKPYPNREGILKVNTHPVSYLGKFGAFNTTVIMCEVGSIGLNSSCDAIKNGIHQFKPRAVIMVGIAGGRSPKKQKIGDVLISSFLIPYDSKRVETSITTYTAAYPPSNAVLRDLCKSVHGWDFKRPDGQKCTVHRPGSILTGGTLLDNLEEKVKLFKEFEKQDPIGMEMEGAGLYTAAEKEVPWIVIKAISDWGDGKKSERRSHRDVASASSASFVHHVLSDQYALESLQ